MRSSFELLGMTALVYISVFMVETDTGNLRRQNISWLYTAVNEIVYPIISVVKYHKTSKPNKVVLGFTVNIYMRSIPGLAGWQTD